MSDLLTNSSAVLSDCGRYRYELIREWSCMQPLGIIMLNPSTADADADDPTIRSCCEFARRGGFGGIRVCNLFAYRSPSTIELAHYSDPIGPRNDEYLRELAATPYVILCAWGATVFGNARATHVLSTVLKERRLWCLGRNKDGSPCHPLYISRNTAFHVFQDGR